MKYLRYHLALIALLMRIVGLGQQPAEIAQPTQSATYRVPQNEPITQDLSRGGSFKAKIASNLPEFTFKLVPREQKADEYGNPQSTIERVEVFRGDTLTPAQSLDGCEWEDTEAPPKGCN